MALSPDFQRSIDAAFAGCAERLGVHKEPDNTYECPEDLPEAITAFIVAVKTFDEGGLNVRLMWEPGKDQHSFNDDKSLEGYLLLGSESRYHFEVYTEKGGHTPLSFIDEEGCQWCEYILSTDQGFKLFLRDFSVLVVEKEIEKNQLVRRVARNLTSREGF